MSDGPRLSRAFADGQSGRVNYALAMAITLVRMDPTGHDRGALIEFLVENHWPFHAGPQRQRDDVDRAIADGAFRDDENDTYWVDHLIEGRVGIVRFEDLTSSPMLDLRLHEQARGKGLAAEVLTAATEHVFTTMPGVHRFEGTTRDDNIAMRKAFLRAGWVKECHYRQGWPTGDGQMRDSVGYAILRDDWASGHTTPVRWDDMS